MPVVRIEPSGFTAHLAEGEPVLSGLFRCGFTVRQVGCRRGGCGICKLDLVSGEVSYERTVAETVLTPDDRAEGRCLSCRAVPVGDITLRLDESDVSSAPLGLLRYLNVAGSPGSHHQPPGPASPPAPSPSGPPRATVSTKEN